MIIEKWRYARISVGVFLSVVFLLMGIGLSIVMLITNAPPIVVVLTLIIPPIGTGIIAVIVNLLMKAFSKSKYEFNNDEIIAYKKNKVLFRIPSSQILHCHYDYFYHNFYRFFSGCLLIELKNSEGIPTLTKYKNYQKTCLISMSPKEAKQASIVLGKKLFIRKWFEYKIYDEKEENKSEKG